MMIAGVKAFPALEGHPIIARGFTPWKKEKVKTGALKGRLIIYAYPEINPYEMEESRKYQLVNVSTYQLP
ncbi:MAG: hypothetical protein NTV79_03425 [Candidatus Aureabacteria bacterium]|nr:hypothetical protein [Candidatus Auribacterota bacterium]